MNFSGKVVIITGASSGIGAAAARHLAKLGAKVSIIGRNEKRLNEVAQEIIKAGSLPPLPIIANVTTDQERIINETVAHYGKIDVLVNNAGIFGSDTVIDFDVNYFDDFLNTNLKSVIILTKLAVPHLEKTKGNVINISSVEGIRAVDIFTTYCISKAGLDQFTKCAALALGAKGIRVNSVNPALIRTPSACFGVNESEHEQFLEERKSDYLVRRIGEVSDTSAAIAFLASETFLTGILLPVDGGALTLGIRRK